MTVLNSENETLKLKANELNNQLLQKERLGIESKNILYVSHFNGKMTGAESSLLNIIRNLERNRYRPIVVCRSQGVFTETLNAMGVEVIYLDFPVLCGALDNQCGIREGFSFLRDTLKSARDLNRVIGKKRIDLVHSNISVILLGVFIARFKGIPHVWHVREILPEGPWKKLFSIFIPLLSGKVIAVSYASSQAFSSRKCAVIHDGVDSGLLLKGTINKELSKRLNLEDSLLTVGFIGSIISWKGAHIFLKSASKVAEIFPEAQFVVAGDVTVNPPYFNKLKEFVHLEGLETKVKFVGFQENISEFLPLLDIVVVPSRRPDPAPNVMIEAMAKGRVVVASRNGGIPEFINDGESGFLFSPGDWESLSRILVSLLQDDKLRNTIGIAAQKRVSEEFLASKMTGEIQGVYDDLLGIGNSFTAAGGLSEMIAELKYRENMEAVKNRWITDKTLDDECASFCIESYLEKERSRKKNILIVTPELPYPLDRGGNIRIFTHINYIIQEMYAILNNFFQFC